jgi:hypothetical protein
MRPTLRIFHFFLLGLSGCAIHDMPPMSARSSPQVLSVMQIQTRDLTYVFCKEGDCAARSIKHLAAPMSTALPPSTAVVERPSIIEPRQEAITAPSPPPHPQPKKPKPKRHKAKVVCKPIS